MRLLVVFLISAVATFASPQTVTLTITPDTDITLTNSGNVAKLIKKDSGNLHRNTYYINSKSTPPPNSQDVEKNGSNGTKMTTDIDMHLALIGQVI